MKTSVTFRRRQLSCSTSVVALLLAAAVIAGMPTTAQANDWTGAVSNDWFTAGNWSNIAAVPTAGDAAVIDTMTPNPTSISGGNASASAVSIGNTGAGALQVSNGGVLTLSGPIISMIIGSGSSGSVTVTGAGSKISTAGGVEVGFQGIGTLTISNGGAVEANGLQIAPLTGGATGLVTVDGANSSLTTQEIDIGPNTFVGATGGVGTLAISNGGVVVSTQADLGTTVGGSGVVTVDGAGSSWRVASSLTIGGFITNVGGGGIGTLTISNGGAVSAGSVVIAGDPDSTGTLNIGAAPGSAPVAPGTLNTASVAFGSGTGVINFNHTSATYTFGAAISGAGTINQLAGTTFLTADSSGFTGPTNISGGALHVNGSLSGSGVTVMNGGTLAGNGTVGSVTAQAGAIVAPGNSVGTLTVVGNYAQAAGSTYQVQLGAGTQSDRINVGGTAMIANGALLSVDPTGSQFALGTRYTLLTAAGGVNGTYTFAGAPTLSAFLDGVLSYDTNDVFLSGVQTRSFVSAAVTPNQIATAGAAAGLPQASSVFTAILNSSTAAAAQRAFDQLSGEIHASAKTALIEDSRFVRDAAINRLRSAFGAVGASSAPLAAYAADGKPVAVAATTDGLAFWGQGFGSFGSTSGDGNAAKLNRSTGGFLAGGDAAAFDGARIGALGGYSRTNFDVNDRGSSGTSDNYHFGLYGGSQWGALGFRTGAAYTWHQIATSRSVVLPGLGEQVSSGYAAGTSQVFGDLGYRINAGHTAVGALAFEPFANLAYVNLWTGGFSETGGAAALTGRSGTTDVTFSTLGLRAATDFSLNGMAATARGSLGWRHAAGDVAPTSLLAFAGGGSAFGILGVPIAQDSAVVEAGFDVLVARNVSVGLSYVGQAASHAQDHDFKANMTWKF